jgi:hypothetical protein
MGIIRWNKDSIDNIGMTEVTIFFSQIDEPVPDDFWFFKKRLNMNGFSVRVFGFIFLVCKVEGAQIGMGIIRWNKDSIDNIGMTEVTIFFSQIDEPVPDDLETARIKISIFFQLTNWSCHWD